MKTREAFNEDLEWSEKRQKEIRIWIDETLRYMGEALFTIHISYMKVVIDLRDGSSFYFLYSLNRVDRNDIVGAVVVGMMDREG